MKPINSSYENEGLSDDISEALIEFAKRRPNQLSRSEAILYVLRDHLIAQSYIKVAGKN